MYWLRAAEPLQKTAGMHRFVWDLRHTPPDAIRRGYTMEAVYGLNMPTNPRGALALPGSYEVLLTVAGHSYTQPIMLVQDPRSKTTEIELEKQAAFESEIAEAMAQDFAAYTEIGVVRAQLRAVLAQLSGNAAAKDSAEAAQSFDRQAAAIYGETGPPVFPAHPSGPSLLSANAELSAVATAVDSADSAPTGQSLAAFAAIHRQLTALLAEWVKLKASDLPALNLRFRDLGLPELTTNGELQPTAKRGSR
jgi:hypothetical protein